MFALKMLFCVVYGMAGIVHEIRMLKSTRAFAKITIKETLLFASIPGITFFAVGYVLFDMFEYMYKLL